MAEGHMSLIKYLKKQGIAPHHLYKATVVDNNDPLKIGRIRARVSTLMEGIDDSFLPWAISAANVHPHGATVSSASCGGSGSFSVPAIGTIVFLKWESDDPHNPVYVPYTVDQTTVISLSQEDYPDTHIIYRFLNCSVLTINTKTNELYLYNSGNSNIRIDGNHSSSVKGSTDLSLNGQVTSDFFGDTVLNVKESADRVRQKCGCPKGDGTGTSYDYAGKGNLTINVNGTNVLNNSLNLTVNTNGSTFINTVGDSNTSVTGSGKMYVKGNADILVDGDTKLSTSSLHLTATKDLFVKGKNINMSGDKILMTCQDLEISATQTVLGGQQLFIKEEKDINIVGSPVLIKDAQIHGIIETALSVSVADLSDPKEKTVVQAVAPSKPVKAIPGTEANGGMSGWFTKIAKLVGVK